MKAFVDSDRDGPEADSVLGVDCSSGRLLLWAIAMIFLDVFPYGRCKNSLMPMRFHVTRS